MKTFPFHLQHDAMQCGVACLRMVSEYFGERFTMDELERRCPATAEGVSMLSISRAAEELGLHTVSGRLSIDELSEAPTPCILHWNQNHFVVLYKVKGGKKSNKERIFHIADPGKGLISYREKEFAKHWISTCSQGEDKGIAMLLSLTPMFGRVCSEHHGSQRSLRFLFGYVRQYRRYFFQVLLGLLLASLFQLVLPFLTQAIVDIGIAHKDISFVYLILLGQFVIILSSTTVDFIRRWLLLHIGIRINISLVSDFFAKLLRLPMPFFDTKQTGDILQRMGDHGRVQSFLTGKTLSILYAVVSLIIFSIVLLIYNVTVFLVFLISSTIYGVWISLFLRKRKVLDYCLFEKQAEAQNKTYQMVTTMQEIKLQNCEQRRRWEWEDTQVDLFEVQMKSLKLQQTEQAGSIFINSLKNILVTVFAATAVIKGDMTLGMMLSVQYIIGQLSSPVSQLMGFIYSLQDVRISLERINEVMGKDNEDSPNTARSFQSQDRGICLQKLSFSYEPHSSRKTLENINMEIPQGKVTALVGASGSGKTTILKLLLGYYPPQEGTVLIGGLPISQYNLQWWRSQCGVVMQDGVIFSESIARNIAVDDGEIDTSRLKRAAKMANIEEYIEQLPLKYNTKIGADGTGLSMGQRQRILIARAVYKNPQYIFLDEATNSLDANNEHNITEALNDFFEGKTVLVIAHRLSTVRKADNIIVMEGGHIAEQGTHEQLLNLKGTYYQLVKNQLNI